MARATTKRAKAARSTAARSGKTTRSKTTRAAPRTKAAAGKTATRTSAAKAAATKTTVTRPAATRKPSARATGKPARAAPARRPPQRFVVSHHRDEDFATGLRTYAHYRDLGIAQATHGLAQAHVIRFVGPCDPAEVSKLHYHDIEFQMVYVLKGWVKAEFEGEGAVTMQVGSCWIQPPRIRHMILDYSDDCELLEIILPAEFETVELTA